MIEADLVRLSIHALPNLKGPQEPGHELWIAGREVYGTCLENRHGRKSDVGSNPTQSANQNQNMGSNPIVYSTAARRLAGKTWSEFMPL